MIAKKKLEQKKNIQTERRSLKSSCYAYFEDFPINFLVSGAAWHCNGTTSNCWVCMCLCSLPLRGLICPPTGMTSVTVFAHHSHGFSDVWIELHLRICGCHHGNGNRTFFLWKTLKHYFFTLFLKNLTNTTDCFHSWKQSWCQAWFQGEKLQPPLVLLLLFSFFSRNSLTWHHKSLISFKVPWFRSNLSRRHGIKSLIFSVSCFTSPEKSGRLKELTSH